MRTETREPRRLTIPWLAVISCLLVARPAVGLEWEIEVVHDGKAFSEMSDRSLRLDTQGRPHIAYGEDHLYYAFHDGAAWQCEVADPSGDVGQYASLGLDGSGLPHVSYLDFTNGDLKYAYRDASGWHTVTVDDEGFVGLYTSLALDGSDYPHISYQGTYDLKHAYRDASGWHTETVDEVEHDGARFTSLALDASGTPHISYCAVDEYLWDYHVKYAYHDAAGWHTETVDTAGKCDYEYDDQHTSLALDGTGDPHISYFHYKNHELRHAYRDASGWHTEAVESPCGPVAWASLVLDGSGWPHIGYCATLRAGTPKRWLQQLERCIRHFPWTAKPTPTSATWTGGRAI
jgi:hypothetical protein